MKTISGGVCAAKGFKANGIHCGIRKSSQIIHINQACCRLQMMQIALCDIITVDQNSIRLILCNQLE